MKSTFANLNENKQTVIIEAALQEFITYGYENASTNRLVKNIGISKGSLFKYFNSKLDLYTYLINISVDDLLDHMSKFQVIEKDTYVKNILSYAAFEYDYLIKNPLQYNFFRSLYKDLNHMEISEIKVNLMSKSILMSSCFFHLIGIKDSKLITHLQLIIQAYNNHFMSQLDCTVDWADYKSSYLIGLNNHLNLVKWS